MSLGARPLIIALTGLAQSGKDTAAKYISDKYGFAWFDFSRDVLMDELRKRKQAQTKENMSSLGDELRKYGGPDALAQKLVEKINASGAANVVVSGVRSPEEAQCLKKNAGRFAMIRIVADTKKRIGRSKDTGLIRRDEKDIQNKGLAQVLEMADITIENNGTVDEFYKKIDATLKTAFNIPAPF